MRPKPYSLDTTDEGTAIRAVLDRQENPIELEPDTWAIEHEAYLQDGLARNKISDAYARVRRVTAARFAAEMGIRSPAMVTRQIIQAYYAQLTDKKSESKKTEATAQTYIFGLRGFFNWLKENRKISANPVDGVQMGRQVKYYRHRTCSKEEVDLLLQPVHVGQDGAEYRPDKDTLFIFHCGFEAGLRKNEISEAIAPWFAVPGIVHLQNSATFELKDGDARHVPLTARFEKFLEGYGRPEPFMLAPWKTKKGKAVYRYDFRAPFDRHLDRVSTITGKDLRWVTPHVMRYTFASLRVQKGASIYKVAKWLGDEVETVQRHYGHLAPGRDADVEV